jgi:hypothetical protein
VKFCIKRPKRTCKEKQCPYESYINKPDYGNCWESYKTFIDHEHSIDEIAEILDVSSNCVKQTLEESLKKLKNIFPEYLTSFPSPLSLDRIFNHFGINENDED